MNRKVLVTLLWKEIRDLELITEGFLIMTEYPEEIVQLVVEKTESIQSYIQQLGQFKSEATDFYSIDTSSAEPETELEIGSTFESDTIQPIIESEIEEESIDSSKIPAFIVTSNQEVSIDDHFVELEDELYLHDDAAEVLETVVEVESETPLAIEAPAPKVSEISEEIAPEIINIEASKEEEEEEQVAITTSLQPEAEIDEIKIVATAKQVVLFDELQEEIFVSKVEPEVKELITEQAQKEITPIVLEVVPEKKAEIIKPELNNYQKITDIKQSISLGERFRFQRDLFKSNGEDMNKTIKYINQLSTLNEAISFLEKKYQWDADDESAVDFYQIVKRRFL